MNHRFYTSVYINALPAILKEFPNWCNWSPAPRPNGKIAKAPLTPRTLAPARANDPRTWGTFQEAADRLTKYIGLGFVTDKRHEIIGGDIDNCVYPDGTITDDAMEIVTALGTYTEISPSGTGLRFLCFGDLYKNYQKPGKLELFWDRHFMTLTGDVLDGYTEIRDCTAALKSLVDYYFPKRDYLNPMCLWPSSADDTTAINKLCKDPRRAALWNGDTSAYNGDHSAADLALVNHIFYWTNYDDPDDIDRVFRCSGLYRPKWDEIHTADGLTYGQLTIRKALRNHGGKERW